MQKKSTILYIVGINQKGESIIILGNLRKRCGKVITYKDWKVIKKSVTQEEYIELITEKSNGYCYYYSRLIAVFLDDAQLMYCAIKIGDVLSCHAVILKNHCVYDTNERKHYDYDEYIKENEAIVYKMFSASQYRKESFFDDIREELVEWCRQNKIYCNPQ